MMPLPLAYWVDNLSPFAIRFWGNIGIRWYGLAYVCGFLVGGWLMVRYHRAGRSALPANQVADFILALVIGVLVGGRVGYFLLYDFDLFLHQPLVLFRVWEGGMASHGGFFGVLIAVWWFAGEAVFRCCTSLTSRPRRFPPVCCSAGWPISSTASSGGNSPRCRGRSFFPKSAPDGTPLAHIAPRHPSQLYEAALEGVLLLAFMQWRVWKSSVLRTQPGRLCGEYMSATPRCAFSARFSAKPDAGSRSSSGLAAARFIRFSSPPPVPP